MIVTVLTSEEEYTTAMARLSDLMSLDPRLDTDEERELECLASSIEAYERLLVPPVVSDPVEEMAFRLDQMKRNG